MRTLAEIADRLASSKGLTIEQSGELRTHAARIASAADALEGAIVAPLLSRPIDVPDFIPRILISFMFAGGHAELAVLQPDGEGAGAGKEKPGGEGGGENRTIGVMRLTTEALGRIRVRMDYVEAEGASRVAGQFVAEADAADEIRRALPSLDRALDARGLKSEGFRVIGLKAGDESKPSSNRAGGLDLRA
jgi:hypothetical protein